MLTSMAPLFRSRGVNCDIVALMERPSPLTRILEESKINFLYTGVRTLYSPLQIGALAKSLDGYDIAHVHLFPAQLWAVLATAWLGNRTPLVTTEHNTWNARRRWWLWPLDQWMYTHYQRIVCNSAATAQYLVEWCPDTTENISVIHNGISLRAFETARPAALPGVLPGVTRLVFVGRCEPQKDHATLLRALPAIRDAHLILVGDGPLRPRLEQMAHSLGIKERVSFLGWRDDVASILKASDIYVHPTHSDGFGIAACEAMAAGLPVVASDVPGLAQIVEGAAVLFPPGDHLRLTRELTELIALPARQRKMSEASVRRARQFSIEHTVDEYVRVYESVLERQAKFV